MGFRNGQWVKFDLTPDLHELVGVVFLASDGKGVGLYTAAKGSLAALDDKGNPLGETVDVVKPCDVDGNDIRKLVGVEIYVAKLNPTTLSGLEAITSRDDIPQVRIAAVPDWQPSV